MSFPPTQSTASAPPLSDKTANKKIFDIKGRDRNKPFPVLISSFEQAEKLAYFDERQKRIMDFLWRNGSFTLLLKGKNDVDDLYKLNGTIALRIPHLSILKQLINKLGPLSATSANPSGVGYDPKIANILNNFKDLVHYFIIEKNTEIVSSTIIDLTSQQPLLIRGNFDISRLESF
ncbi:Sua5/YciO/YrdC/YwlC family protein [Seleniivibrio sp.]|uniref:L-threonylcarbamoyladenylate synthase n=1 Tax=Seleniivibrio sp. TaxID=2898801 RepID=UPI0025E7B420|nr:Sua5/YciO/YrdC/YwlC family protein [Seleniivibrio sp.]MCD8554705.1 Sua5/YciO/YrdC/YwlC family protein [Seleniivibrio sp.]